MPASNDVLFQEEMISDFLKLLLRKCQKKNLGLKASSAKKNIVQRVVICNIRARLSYRLLDL